jgi:hypothetical protein
MTPVDPLRVENTIRVGKEGQHHPLGGSTSIEGRKHDDRPPNPRSSQGPYIDEER